MDLKAPVSYRGLDLNTTTRAPGGLISGTQLNAVDFSTVPAAGYSEKRSLGDGRDASDVYLDARRIVLQGQVFGVTRSEAYDLMRRVALAFNPVLAFDDDPAVQGFLPMTFREPTADVTAFPDGMDLVIYVRPTAQPSFQINRDLLGGADSKGGTILYQAALEAIDPRIYVVPPVVVALVGTSGTIDPLNRGTYFSPPRIRLAIPSSLAAGVVTFSLNGASIALTVPNSTHDQVVDYDGAKKILRLTDNGVSAIRMDLLATTHPLVAPGPNDLSWSSTVSLPADPVSLIRFGEAFA